MTSAPTPPTALETLQRRRRAYQLVFNPQDPSAQIVLEDMMAYCRAEETTFHADPRAHALAEGRREVYLRILQHTTWGEEKHFAWATNQGRTK